MVLTLFLKNDYTSRPIPQLSSMMLTPFRNIYEIIVAGAVWSNREKIKKNIFSYLPERWISGSDRQLFKNKWLANNIVSSYLYMRRQLFLPWQKNRVVSYRKSTSFRYSSVYVWGNSSSYRCFVVSNDDFNIVMMNGFKAVTWYEGIFSAEYII